MQTETVRVRAAIRGRVQMVGFRDFVLRHARRAGLSGTVANRSDGSVECVVEGPSAAVEGLLGLLQDGPPSARVDAVEVRRERPTGTLPPMRVTA
ncbi:MAG: acylphosphatase [Candidatus Dormibacteria bacterium]